MTGKEEKIAEYKEYNPKEKRSNKTSMQPPPNAPKRISKKTSSSHNVPGKDSSSKAPTVEKKKTMQNTVITQMPKPKKGFTEA